MGQAKRRGTLEQRIEKAILRNQQLEQNFKASNSGKRLLLKAEKAGQSIQTLATRLVGAQMLELAMLPPPKEKNENL